MAHERATYRLWLFLRHRSWAIGQRNRFRDARSRPGGDGDGIPHCSARREFPAITILAGSASAATTPIGGLIRQRSGGTEEGTNDWKDFGEDEKAQEARRQEAPPPVSQRPNAPTAGPKPPRTSSATASPSTSSPVRRRSRRRPRSWYGNESPAPCSTSTASPWRTWRPTFRCWSVAVGGASTSRSSLPASRTRPTTSSVWWSVAPSRSRTSAGR